LPCLGYRPVAGEPAQICMNAQQSKCPYGLSVQRRWKGLLEQVCTRPAIWVMSYPTRLQAPMLVRYL
jgi:hypothetical protein